MLVSLAAGQLKGRLDVQTSLPLVVGATRYQPIVNCKIEWLVQKPIDENRETCRDLTCLCIVAVLESGDLAVYHTNTVVTGTDMKPISSFIRLIHPCVTRKRKVKLAKRGTMSGTSGGSGAGWRPDLAAPPPPPPPSAPRAPPLPPGRAPLTPAPPPGMPPSSFGSSSLSLPIAIISGASGTTALCVSGIPKPVSISIDRHGMPFVLPIGFPELPYSSSVNGSTGYYCVSGFQAGAASSRGIVAAWFDEEYVGSAGVPKDSPHMAANERGMRSSCTLGVYREVPHLEVVASSHQAVVSIRKMRTGCTVHKCLELDGGLIQTTGPSVEKELLKKKTYVMVVSEELPAYMCGASNGAEEAAAVAARGAKTGFVPSVLAAAEMEDENENYERFFDVTDSFAQPATDGSSLNSSPPGLTERQFKLLLVQDEAVVSSYVLDTKYGEHVTDLEVAYLTVPASSLTTTRQKQAYILLSTSISDKHGEDTQGEGRVLFFGLDYARLASQKEDKDTEKKESEEKKESDKENEGHVMDVDLDPQSALGAAKAKVGTETETGTEGDSKSNFLNSLQITVSLLWEGAGPSSFVKQFNCSTVTAINGVPTTIVSEYILATVGSELFVYKMGGFNKQLEPVALYLSQHYIVSLSIVKNYVVLADAGGGVVMLTWSESDCNFEVLARDGYRSSSLCASMLLDSKLLSLVVTDTEGNLQMFRYNPR